MLVVVAGGASVVVVTGGAVAFDEEPHPANASGTVAHTTAQNRHLPEYHTSSPVPSARRLDESSANYRPAASALASRPRAITRRWISLVPSPINISGASR